MQQYNCESPHSSLPLGKPVNIQPTHDTAAVTICATNFLGKALVLRNSYLAVHPESDFYILIIDKKHTRVHERAPDVRILWAEDLGIAGFLHYAFKFDVIELSTSVKPVVLSLLLVHYNRVLYLDPDICVYAKLDPVLEGLASHSIVVTPHTLTPVMDGSTPSDIEFLRFGAFNLGFIGVSKCEEAFAFLDWWSKRCLAHGYYEPQLGLAVDQKWVDLGPSFFPGMKILRDPGLNVAFWNLHERIVSSRDGVWLVNEQAPLRFFHFSSFSPDNPHAIARKQSRFVPGSRPDLHELMDSYAAELRENGNEYAGCHYGFDYFDDGICVSPSLRRFYAALESKFPREENPFCHGSAFQRFALSHGLAGGKYTISSQPTFKEIGAYSTATRIISLGLRSILRVVGPNRYFSLMKYLAYISSIRNQGGVFPEVSSIMAPSDRASNGHGGSCGRKLVED